MATADNSRTPPVISTASGVGTSNRLLAASRVVHQLWRTQDYKVDLNRLLADEAFAKRLLATARAHADAKTSAFIDAFEKASVESGAWRTISGQIQADYKANVDGSISAAAAWDPDYVPPTSPQDGKAESEYIPTTSPRTSITAKDTGNSHFISRFGFSRPAEPSDLASAPRPSSRSAPLSSRTTGTSTQTPQPEPADEPIDPNHKKYIRGAR